MTIQANEEKVEMAKETVAHAVAEMSRFEIDSPERIRDTMLSSIEAERQMIRRLAKDADQETLEDLSSDDHFLGEAEKVVGQLLLVGLYRVVENLTKQILRHRFPEGKVNKCYKVDQLKKVFADELGSDLTKVAKFKEIDELRDLNNKVKHGGKLAEHPHKTYERLVGAVYPYLYEIGMVVLP
jgi:hypothetical protein